MSGVNLVPKDKKPKNPVSLDTYKQIKSIRDWWRKYSPDSGQAKMSDIALKKLLAGDKKDLPMLEKVAAVKKQQDNEAMIEKVDASIQETTHQRKKDALDRFMKGESSPKERDMVNKFFKQEISETDFDIFAVQEGAKIKRAKNTYVKADKDRKKTLLKLYRKQDSPYINMLSRLTDLEKGNEGSLPDSILSKIQDIKRGKLKSVGEFESFLTELENLQTEERVKYIKDFSKPPSSEKGSVNPAVVADAAKNVKPYIKTGIKRAVGGAAITDIPYETANFAGMGYDFLKSNIQPLSSPVRALHELEQAYMASHAKSPYPIVPSEIDFGEPTMRNLTPTAITDVLDDPKVQKAGKETKDFFYKFAIFNNLFDSVLGE